MIAAATTRLALQSEQAWLEAAVGQLSASAEAAAWEQPRGASAMSWARRPERVDAATPLQLLSANGYRQVLPG